MRPFSPFSKFSNCTDCSHPHPPQGSFLDRVVSWFEADGKTVDASAMLKLEDVLSASDFSQLSPMISRFYANPIRFRIHAGLDGGAWSRFLLSSAARISRQCLAPSKQSGFQAYPVCQWLYLDQSGRVHWDRYACVDGHSERLFVARVSATAGLVCETFVLYGVPVALSFRPAVEGGELSLRLISKLSSPFSWFARVEYRTKLHATGVVTHGDLRIPLIGFQITTEFRAEPA
jgi:hypothetical protein